MTSEGLGEMFEGDSADTSDGKFPLMSMGGPSGGSSMHRHGSEDPHRRERKLFFLFLFSIFSYVCVLAYVADWPGNNAGGCSAPG